MDYPRYEDSAKSYETAGLLAVVGGYLDAYTCSCRGGVFANAQTGNIARMAIALANGQFSLCLRYLASIMSFIIGVSISMWLQRKAKNRDWQPVAVAIEVCLLGVVAFIPLGEQANIIANILVSLTCAVQVKTFRKFSGNVFASTMCTGNLRSATENLNLYLQNRDPEHKIRSIQYFGIILLFVLGAVLGTWCTNRLGAYAVLICCGFLAAVFAQCIVHNKAVVCKQ